MAIGSFSQIPQLAPRPRSVPAMPLDSLLQGFQQGNTLVNLPQILSEQEAQKQAQLLNLQLSNAIAQQKLADLANPNAAVARRLAEDLAIKGITQPKTGIEIAPLGLEGLTIAQPGTVTAQQEALLGLPVTEGLNIAAQAPITPINIGAAPTGFNLNPTLATNARQQELKDKVAAMEAQAKARGISGQARVDSEGNVYFMQTSGIQAGTAPVITDLNRKEIPKGKGSGSSRELTPNSRMNILNKAATYLNVDDPRYYNSETGEYNYTALTIDGAKAARRAKEVENLAKASASTGATKDKIDALNAVELQLNSLKENLTQLADSPSTPGFMDSVLATMTAQPADGFFSALVTKGAKALQSDESKYLEGQKSIVNSALTQAISGLAVTAQEAARLGFLPRPEDSFRDTLNKLGLVEQYIANQREGLQVRSSGGNQPVIEQTQSNSGTPIPSGASALDRLRAKYPKK